MMQHRSISGFAIGVSRQGESMRDVLRSRLETCGGASAKRWFAVRVMTGREKAVENKLSEIGIEALVPMRKGPDYRRRHRIIPGHLMPVIHGYVLVEMPNSGVDLVALQAVEYFLSVVGGYDNPMALTDAEVKRFKGLADEGLYDWEGQTGKQLKRGDKAKIWDGPFTGFTGEVESCRSDGKGDVVITIDMFGRATPVTVPLAMCDKL